MQKITVIPGDGIGPEVIESAIDIMNAAGVRLSYDFQKAGAKVFLAGNKTGVPQETIESIKSNKVVFKGPLETPIGYGEKSANVTLRKCFETFANIRPAIPLPNIKTPFSNRPIDLVIIRENIEDLYAGIEYLHSKDMAVAHKIISRLGSEKCIRYAFEYAKATGRKKVHCATKANILKLTEGLIKEVFETVSKDYPSIEAHHIIIDNCAHQLVMRPDMFEVIVTSNLHGDIISDLSSGLVGGLGVAPSANIGKDVAIFEAVHGSAPDIAGQNIANPTASILASALLLKHLNMTNIAIKIEHALYKTLEDGIFTKDIATNNSGLGTKEFSAEVIKRLGQNSTFYVARPYHHIPIPNTPNSPKQTPECIGIDLIINSNNEADKIASDISAICPNNLTLKFVSNRGTVTYPNPSYAQPISTHRIRLIDPNKQQVSDSDIQFILSKISEIYNWTGIQKLLSIEGTTGYTSAQGES